MTATKDGLLKALLAVQKEAPTLKKGERATVQTKTGGSYTYTYVALDAIVEQVRPLLTKNDLVWSTFPSFDETSGEPTLRYSLAHTSGDSLDGEMKLLLAAPDAQGQGSAITYARRYALCAVLDLVAEDDDDGNRAAQSGEANGRAGRPSEKQVEFLQSLIKQNRPTTAQLKYLLGQVGAPDVEIQEGWAQKLTGGKEGQASALIELLKEGRLPPVEEATVPPSDVPEPAADEFVHPAEAPIQ